MTDQAPDKLIISHSDIDFEGRFLYEINLSEFPGLMFDDEIYCPPRCRSSQFPVTSLWR